MKEEILSLLKTKFTGARPDGLAQLAGSLALTATTKEDAQALVEKLTAEQVTDFVKEWRKEVDAEVTKGKNTYEENLKKKFDLVAKKSEEPNPNPTPPAPTPTPGGKGDDTSEIVKQAVAAALEPFQKQLNEMKGAETSKTRYSKLEGALNDAPPVFKENTLKNFARMSFENDEDFENYVTDTAADLAKYKQTTADDGLRKFGTPGVSSAANQTKDVSESVKTFIASKTGDKAESLGGKEV